MVHNLKATLRVIKNKFAKRFKKWGQYEFAKNLPFIVWAAGTKNGWKKKTAFTVIKMFLDGLNHQLKKFMKLV